MAARLAKDKVIDLDFYAADGAVLILASWDEDEEHENPALDVEVLAKYFVLKRGGI
jgi:hypothetical protein